jgi:hypothetical protein
MLGGGGMSALAEVVKDILNAVSFVESDGSRWGLDTDCGKDADLIARGVATIRDRLGVSVCSKCGGMEIVINAPMCGCGLDIVSIQDCLAFTIATEPGKVEVREVQTTMAQDIARQIEQGSTGPEWGHR